MRKALFLDRDGVLIGTSVRGNVPHPPQSLEEMIILPGVPRALEQMKRLGFALLMVTNQPDVARGLQTRAEVERINAALAGPLALDGVYVCYHDNADRCDCRKPAPGMLRRGAMEHQIDLPASYMIGDRASDILAGEAAGCVTCLIEKSYSQAQKVKPALKAADLVQAAHQIAQRERDRFGHRVAG